MKKTVTFILSIVFSMALFAQNSITQDVLYLHDGTIVRGVITDSFPNRYVSILTPDGVNATYPMDLIDRLESEEIAYNSGYITKQKGHYYQNDTEIKDWKQLKSVLSTNPKSKRLTTIAEDINVPAMILGYVGGGMMGYPLGQAFANALGAGVDVNWNILFIGAGVGAAGLGISLVADRYVRKAVEAYNACPPLEKNTASSDVVMHIGFTGNGGVGLTINF